MTIEQAIIKVDNIISGLETELQNASEELALSLMGMVVNRIQQKGLEGRQYSKNPLPEYFFYDRWLNAGGRALYEKKTRKKIREAISDIGIRKNKRIDEQEDGITYEEWRIANGLQVAHVDLTFSGRMFQNLGIIGTKKVGEYYVTVIGGTNPEVILKLEWNKKRFGDFLKPTQEEAEKLKAQFHNRMNNYLNKMAA